MSDFAESTWNGAKSTTESCSTNQKLLQNLGVALDATTKFHQISRGLVSSDEVVKNAKLLAEGGYNSVWFITATVHAYDGHNHSPILKRRVNEFKSFIGSCIDTLGLASIFPSFGLPATDRPSSIRELKFVLRVPKEGSLLPYQVRNEVGFPTVSRQASSQNSGSESLRLE